MQYKDDKTLQLSKMLGIVVAKKRSEKGFSAHKFANEYDLDSGNLSRIEHGVTNCKFVTFWKIAEALGIKPSEFVKILEEELGDNFTLIDE